ncbi:hypothetical protein [Candidatus Enterococcus ikei]|uniref:Uncharacterized protein n=1 Tax=Candidatus Enterococcus ikei TaxID=2815326 RepID=A0ABS3H0W2_9ENTE|nr:hypothetical protein [Enterococcus sp. DIV0869a]MBO0441150.1 hypothetical protein [Enterococcus sp. DIV0869a]
MKKYILGILVGLTGLIGLIFPSVSLAADSPPLTITGERVKFNTPYYLKDRNENYGGATFQVHASYDYVLFTNDKTSLGTPIIFEAQDMRDGDINIDDLVTVKSANANWPGWNYWKCTGDANVYLSNKASYEHKLYSDSYSRTTGIGLMWDSNAKVGIYWSEYYINTGSTPWMKIKVNQNGKNNIQERSTPFVLIKAN